MANFEPIVEWLLYQEDDHRTPGKIENLGDGGGFTRLGITSKNFGSVMPVDFFSSMQFKQAVQAAKKFYQNQFWSHMIGDQINQDEMAAVLLSASVNTGIGIAVKMIQNILQITMDGHFGMETLTELNKRNIVTQFRVEWSGHYHDIVDNNPNDAKFLDGWLNRVNFPYPSSLVGNIYG